MCLTEEIAKLQAERGASREIAEAMHDMDGLVDEGLTWRLGQAAEARNRAGHGDDDDKATYDMAPNGARLNREERDAFARLLDEIGHGKNKLPPS